MKPEQENAAQRVRRRIKDRLETTKDRPRQFRKDQRRMATDIGIAESSLSELLGSDAERGLLFHLDRIAAYLGVPPSLLVHRNDTSLIEVQLDEFRLLTHWRTFPTDVQSRIMELFDYFAGLLPEEKEHRRWWFKLRRLTPQEREQVERSVERILRAKTPAPKTANPPTPRPADTAPKRSTQRELRASDDVKKG